MSLLLDALKKAADDKQKTLQLEQANSDEIRQRQSSVEQKNDNANDDSPVRDEDAVRNGEYRLQRINDAQKIDELVLADMESSNTVDDSHLDSNNNAAAEALTSESGKSRQNADAATLSDEALAMLIHKTNRAVKHSRLLLVFVVIAVSLIILAAAGVFYYMQFQQKISVLERKHQIAMQSMQLKVGGTEMATKAEVLASVRSAPVLNESVLSEAVLNEKVPKTALPSSDNKKTSKPTTALPQKTEIKTPAKVPPIKAKPAVVSIQKTKKVDPVGEKLEAAWLAYEDMRLGMAKSLYQSVLSLEGNNRDALLGLGAIAVIEKDISVAKQMYMALLELDPRDAIAIAALANLPGQQASLADKNYLLSALRKNPNAHHLNFALGNIYAQQNNWQAAQQAYFNAWQHNSDNADYVFNLAVSLDQLGKQKQALKFYEDSLLKSKNKQVNFSRQAVRVRISELSRQLLAQ